MLRDPVFLQQAQHDRDRLIVKRCGPAIPSVVNRRKEFLHEAVLRILETRNPIIQRFGVVVALLPQFWLEGQPSDLISHHLGLLHPLLERVDLDARVLTRVVWLSVNYKELAPVLHD